VICGDWNIAHTPMDIRNAKSNQKNSGFLPEERDWLTKLFKEHGWVDSYGTCIRKGRTTPGGASAAPRARRTSAGASTTRW
jgi:exonuclease III